MANNGLNMNFYIDTAGVGQGTNAILDIVEDCNINRKKNTTSVKNRASKVERKLTGLRVESIELTLTHEPSNTLYQALLANFEASDNSYIGVLAMDGPVPASGTDSVGMQMDVVVTEFSQTQGLEDSSARKVVLEPSAKSTFAPAEVTVAAV